MNIELKGFNGHGWMVCDTCPANNGGPKWGCKFGYPRTDGKLNTKTGKIVTSLEVGVWVTLRPRMCIDKHGK